MISSNERVIPREDYDKVVVRTHNPINGGCTYWFQLSDGQITDILTRYNIHGQKIRNPSMSDVSATVKEHLREKWKV